MSERPPAANAVMSRLRRPMGRLRDTPIWAKLGLIMIVPTIATVIVGTSGLVTHIQTQSTAERARDLASLSQAAGQLVHALQNERAAAAMLLAGTAGDEQNKSVYTAAHNPVEEAKRPYSQQRNTISGVPATFATLLNQIDAEMSGLPPVRSQVLNNKIKLSEAVGAYDDLIRVLLSARESAAQLAGDNSLAERERAAAEISRMKEFISQRRVVVHQVLDQKSYIPRLRTEYISTTTGQEQAREDFETVATRGEKEYFEQIVAGSVLRKVDRNQGFLNGKTDEDIADIPFNAADWDTAMREYGDLIRQVESQFDGRIVNLATDLRNDVQRRVLIETGLLLGMLLLAILFAWLVARSMARSLRELRHGALAVAQYGLPQAVARLRDPSLSTQLSPAQVANQIAEPLPVRSKDEFGQVTEAFNAVHLEAVRTAAEQAALRSSVSTMFVNLARRSQILVDRLIGHLDRLERGEEDPDRLAELFQLDHLATRMRRNDENLLVLAGADSTRVQREPAALIDVLRAAQSEVEHYTRIEFGVVDRDIEVAAHAVNDLVHLVAELFDNATAFSPPDSHVVVEARRVGDRAVLYVEDRGIGITPDQLIDLNERLATPPQVDVAVSRMMGLVVVARLAARHGVKVELRPAAERGTIADVTLPPAVLVPRALSGRLGPSAQGPQMASAGPTQAPPRSPFGPPLALESGPTPAPAPASPRGASPLSGRPFEPVPSLNGGGLGGAGRGMPAWSDLTGATVVNGNGHGGDAFSPRTPNGQQHSDPLPQRRGNDHWPSDVPGGPGAQGPMIPRQPAAADARGPLGPQPAQAGPPTTPPVSAPPVVSTPPVVSASPAQQGPALPTRTPTPPPVKSGGTPPTPAPPAWPPVAPDRETTPPPVPEKLSAALDMTAEIPKLRPAEPVAGNAHSTSTPANAASAAGGVTAPQPVVKPSTPKPAARPAEPARPRLVDETMELPIFRELESAWFRTRRSAPEDSAMPAAEFATVDARRSTGRGQPPVTASTTSMPVRGTDAGAGSSPTPPPAPKPPPRLPESPTPPGWQTAADEGWRAATAASEVSITETTSAGLPKRTPMAQLVPGGIDKSVNAVQRRTPEGVRGLLSAYHRGVQRGRSQPKDDSPTSTQPTPAGQQSAQAGKEHEA